MTKPALNLKDYSGDEMDVVILQNGCAHVTVINYSSATAKEVAVVLLSTEDRRILSQYLAEGAS